MENGEEDEGKKRRVGLTLVSEYLDSGEHGNKGIGVGFCRARHSGQFCFACRRVRE